MNFINHFISFNFELITIFYYVFNSINFIKYLDMKKKGTSC